MTAEAAKLIPQSELAELPSLAADVESVSPSAWSFEHCGAALSLLLTATLNHETKVAARDRAIADISRKHDPYIEAYATRVGYLSKLIEDYFTAHQDELISDERKSVQFSAGMIGVRAPSTPALVPLNAATPWERIASKVRRVWGASRYFRKKERQLDVVKLKRELSAEQLAKLGLKLDDSENFYIKLNRLAEAA